MPSSDARTWIDARVDEVVGIVTDAARLGEWFEPARPVGVAEGTDLGLVGTSVDVTWQLGHAGPGRMRTTRRVRDVLHLEVEDAAGTVGRVCISLSPWQEGTMVELRADLDGWPVRGFSLRRALRRSVRHLAQRAASSTSRVTASPRRRIPDVRPEHDAGAIPTS